MTIPARHMTNRRDLLRTRADLERRAAIYESRLAECNAALDALDEPDKEPDKTPEPEPE